MFLNRELSWLAFNRRVLEEAEDERKPLLERVKFLAIAASNLDEFVMVRYAELRAIACGELSDKGYVGDPKADLRMVRTALTEFVTAQYACWQTLVAPAVAAIGTRFVPVAQWIDNDREAMRRLWVDKLEPVLTPLAVDPTRPFPMLANRGIHVAVRLSASDGTTRRALVSVPAGSRLVALPAPAGRWTLAEDLIGERLGSLFTGYRVEATAAFRITRDGALEIDEQSADDLLSEIEQELSSRERSEVVRLEVVAGADADLIEWLRGAMALDVTDVVTVAGPLDLTVLFAVGERIDRPDLRDAPFVPLVHPSVEAWADPFARLREGELLLHHPYQSFAPVVELVQKAAADPRVLAIKQTLYRVSGDSPIVVALIAAAHAGKQVTVLMELKARFDEATNIKWAKRLEQAGAHVIYGLVGYKVHAKLLMVIRRDPDGIRRYVHLGTGNYNDRTARLYTDLSYLTANEAVGRDVAGLFNMLTGYSQPPEWERLAVAPLTLRSSFVAWIHREIAHAKAGKPARIIAKFNSLVDTAICEELYAASRAGVEIDLIVRGMCILQPGVPGQSETIRVRSLVGRFLEHHRIYWFANRESAASRPVVAIASADWMTRNLDRRIECLVRIEDEHLQERLFSLLEMALADNVQARELRPDGTYVRLRPVSNDDVRSTVSLWAADAAAQSDSAGTGRPALRFKPQRSARSGADPRSRKTDTPTA